MAEIGLRGGVYRVARPMSLLPHYNLLVFEVMGMISKMSDRYGAGDQIKVRDYDYDYDIDVGGDLAGAADAAGGVSERAIAPPRARNTSARRRRPHA